GAPIDQRSDLFSFGIILCELLSGKHPFRRSSPLATMNAIVHDPPDLVVTGSSKWSPGLMVLVRRLLAKLPDERYPLMSQVRADMAKLATQHGLEPEQEARAEIPLIGREPERIRLLRLLDAACAGRGSLALIGGEPGIGKT